MLEPTSLHHMCRSAGRLFDFTGSYNKEAWRKRLTMPAWERDCLAFEQDAKNIGKDLEKAFVRVKVKYGHTYKTEK